MSLYENLEPCDKRIYTDLMSQCNECKGYENCTLPFPSKNFGVSGTKGHMPVIKKNKYGRVYIAWQVCNKALEAFEQDRQYSRCNDNTIYQEKYNNVQAHNYSEIMSQFNKNYRLYLYSDVGLGKTHFAKYVGKKYHKQGRTVYINKMVDILNEIKRTFTNDVGMSTANQQDILEYITNVDVLILDDLGSENASKWSLLEILQTIIDARYVAEGKITIITSNYTPTKLGEVYLRVKDTHPDQIKRIISRLKTFGVTEYKSKQWRVLPEL